MRKMAAKQIADMLAGSDDVEPVLSVLHQVPKRFIHVMSIYVVVGATYEQGVGGANGRIFRYPMDPRRQPPSPRPPHPDNHDGIRFPPD